MSSSSESEEGEKAVCQGHGLMICYCTRCYVFMGDDNPRQLCRKIYCNASDCWICHLPIMDEN